MSRLGLTITLTNLIIYLVLNGISPEDPVQMVMEVHPNSYASVLGLHQYAETMSVDVADQQIPSIGEYERRLTSCNRKYVHLHYLAYAFIQSHVQVRYIAHYKHIKETRSEVGIRRARLSLQ